MSKSGFEKNKLLFMGKEFETNTCGKCVVINYEGFLQHINRFES